MQILWAPELTHRSGVCVRGQLRTQLRQGAEHGLLGQLDSELVGHVPGPSNVVPRNPRHFGANRRAPGQLGRFEGASGLEPALEPLERLR